MSLLKQKPGTPPASEAGSEPTAAPVAPDTPSDPSPIWVDRLIGGHRDRAVVLALVLFAVLLRVLLFGMGAVAVQLGPESPDPNDVSVGLTWDATTDAYRRLAVGDPPYYISIAERGYTERPYVDGVQENWGFFPGWPIVIWLVGLPLGGRDLLAAVLSANVLSLLAIPLLYRLFRMDWSRGVALASTAALVVFATPHLMRPGTESLFLLLSVGAIYAARKHWWWVAGATAAFASITRPNGLVVAAVLAFMFWRQWRRKEARLVRDGAAFALIPIAFGAYLAHMQSVTGNAMAYFDTQRTAWGQKLEVPFVPLLRWVAHPRLTSDSGWEFVAYSTVLGFGMLALAAIGLYQWRKGRLYFPTEYWILLGLSFLFVASTNKQGGFGRYMVAVFPLFALFVLVTRRHAFFQVLAGSSMLMLQTFLFVNYLLMETWAGA